MYYFLKFPLSSSGDLATVSVEHGKTTCSISMHFLFTKSTSTPSSINNDPYCSSGNSIPKFYFTCPSWITGIDNISGNSNVNVTYQNGNVNINFIKTLESMLTSNSYSEYFNIHFKVNSTATTPQSSSVNLYDSNWVWNNFNYKYTIKFSRYYYTYGSLSISPTTLDFGNVKMGETVTKNITVILKNTYNVGWGKYISLKDYLDCVSVDSYQYTNGTKSDTFTSSGVAYATYTCIVPIKFTGKYFDNQKYSSQIYSSSAWNNTEKSANITFTANVIDENSSSGTVANTSGSIYLGNNLLSGFGDNLPIGTILMFYGSKSSIPSNWHVCDGTNGTPNLQDRVIVCASQTKPVGQYGGSRNFYDDYTLTINQMPEHYHTYIIPKIYVGWSDNADDRKVVRWDNDSGLWENRTSSKSGSGSPIYPPKYYMLLYIMKISA